MNLKRLDLQLLSLKLTVIFGLTWALGFAAALKETAFIWYPFVILNSLQGKCLILTIVSVLMVLNRSVRVPLVSKYMYTFEEISIKLHVRCCSVKNKDKNSPTFPIQAELSRSYLKFPNPDSISVGTAQKSRF